MSSNWGGRREGAGRKKCAVKKKPICIYIDETLLDAIDAQRGEQPRSRFIEEAIAMSVKL